MSDTVDSDIEAILADRYSLLPLWRAAKPFMQALPDNPASVETAKHLAEVEATRAELRMRPSEELRQMAAQCRQRARERVAAAQAAEALKRTQKEDEAERARFYNQPEAKADLDLWLQLDTWTPSEAAAILMGRDPRVVNPDALKLELTKPVGLFGLGKPPKRSKFHNAIERLELILSRAEVCVNGRIKPADAVQHVQALRLRVPSPLQALLPAPVEAKAVSASPKRQSGDRWTEEELQELAADRERYGPKAAAERHGISGARLRKLLPTEPKAPSALPSVTWTARR